MTESDAFNASVGSVQRIAMRIIELPKDQREAAIEIARRNFSESLKVGKTASASALGSICRFAAFAVSSRRSNPVALLAETANRQLAAASSQARRTAAGNPDEVQRN